MKIQGFLGGYCKIKKYTKKVCPSIKVTGWQCVNLAKISVTAETLRFSFTVKLLFFQGSL